MSEFLFTHVEDLVDGVLDDKVSLQRLVTEAMSLSGNEDVEKAAKALYVSGLAKTGQLLRSSRDLGAWQQCSSALLRGESWMRSVALNDLAERIATLYDLLEDAIRVGSKAPKAALLTRAHVQELLSYIISQGGSASRETARKELKLRDANFTRLLNLLESERLIQRNTFGKRRIISITEDGMTALGELSFPEHLHAIALHSLERGSTVSISKIPVQALSIIEKEAKDLTDVVVVADSIEQPRGSLANAVIDNFMEGVIYHFLVSHENYDAATRIAEQAFSPLLKKASEATGKSFASNPWRVRPLATKYKGNPYIFYLSKNPDNRYALAFIGSDRRTGISKKYMRIDPEWAYSVFKDFIDMDRIENDGIISSIRDNIDFSWFKYSPKNILECKSRPPYNS